MSDKKTSDSTETTETDQNKVTTKTHEESGEPAKKETETTIEPKADRPWLPSVLITRRVTPAGEL